MNADSILTSVNQSIPLSMTFTQLVIYLAVVVALVLLKLIPSLQANGKVNTAFSLLLWVWNIVKRTDTKVGVISGVNSASNETVIDKVIVNRQERMSVTVAEIKKDEAKASKLSKLFGTIPNAVETAFSLFKVAKPVSESLKLLSGFLKGHK